MSLIPMMRCRDMRASVAFYTGILDFERTGEADDPAEHDFITLGRGGHRLALSHDDGVFGTVVVVATPDVDAVFRLFRRRGLRTPGNPDAPAQVHEGPIDQTWGTREFYVEDPDGNTLRFTQPLPSASSQGIANTASPVVRDFFNRYAASRSGEDSGLIVSQYPESFMFAGPKGVRVAEKAAVLAAFPKGREFLTSLGHQSTEVLTLAETNIDEHYLLVRAVFAWHFQREPAARIDLEIESTFIVHLDQGVLRIVFQHEHEDFQQALRAAGVLPTQS